MRNRRTTHTSLSTLISLAILYLVLVSLVLVFSNQLLSDLSFTVPGVGSYVLIPALAFPLVLLSFIIVYLVRLFKERSSGHPGGSFKTRLLVFFVLIVILAAGPQGVLSINFISTAMQAWFSDRTGEALEGGLAIALEYYDDKVSSLERYASGGMLENVLTRFSEDPVDSWDLLRRSNHAVDAFQVFDEVGMPVFAAGSEIAHVPSLSNALTREGLVVRDTVIDRSLLRFRRTFLTEPENEQFTAVMSVVLPADFDLHAQLLTSSRETFVQLDRLQATFIIALSVFYAFFSFPLLLLAILVSFFLSDEIIRPIVNLEEATRRVAEGDFSIRILTRSRDDLANLVDSFNRMVSELERNRLKILQTEKVAAWQEIAQRLAHEIKNPLTPIKLSSERLVRKHENGAEDFDSVFVSSMRSIITEVDALSNMLSEFSSFTRMPEPHFEQLYLADLIEDVAATYADYSKTELEYDEVAPDLVVEADRSQLKQVFANLFKNAIEAMADGGKVIVRADVVTKGNSRYCRIQVRDTGPGIATEHHAQVFHPYFTTKRSGTGLGLSIVERIVVDHGGQMWFETELGVGTTFFIDIPGKEKS
ncbi:MAG: HAMP domain-containing protein [Spirochaetaceae bacterium]|nr:MAG: HAMP domain-containing protein [Spirochaetaceae bacterium]